jgi:hypothetical protein
MATPREVLLLSSRLLNDQIRGLDEALASGERPQERIDVMRREAVAALERLRAVQGGAGIVGETIPKVSEHLDLFIEIAGSAGTDPSLSRKLLRHLLDEQLELTALAEREGVPGASTPGPPAASRGASPPGGGVPAGGTLPGGRRPLTVGSLIDR